MDSSSLMLLRLRFTGLTSTYFFDFPAPYPDDALGSFEIDVLSHFGPSLEAPVRSSSAILTADFEESFNLSYSSFCITASQIYFNNIVPCSNANKDY